MARIGIIIPAHNEGIVIKKTLQHLLTIISGKDIYVIDDASTDNTVEQIKEFSVHLIQLKENQGKAYALNTVIERIFHQYDYILPLDADTVLDKNFITVTTNILDTQTQVVAVVGKIIPHGTFLITWYRIWEYELSQSIHKKAQSIINSILVCSGCATVYRSTVFQHLLFPSGTVTEDMDMTFLIHRQRLGSIVYAPNACVSTQEPQGIHDYTKQTLRWFTGFWQSIQKHDVPWGGQRIDAEAGLMALESLTSAVVFLSIILSIPFLIQFAPHILLTAIVLDACLFMIPSVLYVTFRSKYFGLPLSIPWLYFMRFYTSALFIISFFRALYRPAKKITWNKVQRYHHASLYDNRI